MKTQYSVLFLLMVLVSCNILETEEQYPGVSIYKTRGDYFNLVDIGMKGDEIFRTENFWNARYNSLIKLEIHGNDTVYKSRYKLPHGYILDSEANVYSDVFLDITIKEQLYRELSGNHPGASMPLDTVRKYILDKDPYLEFYRNKTEVKRFELSDSLEIREIILNGEINKYFDKLK